MLKPPQLKDKIGPLITDKSSKISARSFTHSGTEWCFTAMDAAVKFSQRTASRGRHIRYVLRRAIKNA